MFCIFAAAKHIVNANHHDTIKKIKDMRIGMTEIIIIALIILLLFGGKKIPELMKGLGKGVRSFKEGVDGKDDLKEHQSDTTEKKENTEEKQ